jgi:membrane fusion protein (multidrug efflux system)
VQRVSVRIALDDADPNLARVRPGLSTIATIDTRTESGGRK